MCGLWRGTLACLPTCSCHEGDSRAPADPEFSCSARNVDSPERRLAVGLTSRGLRWKARGVASSSGLNSAHRPVCASRNVGTPLSADTPAPVNTVTLLAAARRWSNSAGIVMDGLLRLLKDPTTTINPISPGIVLRETRRSSKPEYRARYPDARPFTRREHRCRSGLHRPDCGGSTPPSCRVRVASIEAMQRTLNPQSTVRIRGNPPFRMENCE